jgi:hypothetical protein
MPGRREIVGLRELFVNDVKKQELNQGSISKDTD